MDVLVDPASLPQLPPPLLLHIAQLCGPSARPCLRATRRALRPALAPTRMQLLLGPNPSDEWVDDNSWQKTGQRHAELVEHFQQDWSLSESLAVEWRHVTIGQVVIGGYADNRPVPGRQHSDTQAVQQLDLASGTLAHWRQLQDVRAPFSRALVTTLVACCPQLRVLQLSDASFNRADLRGSDWDPDHLKEFYKQEVWLSLQLLQGCSTLRQLQLHMAQLMDEVVQEWRWLSQLTQLQALELSWLHHDDDESDAVFIGLAALTQLTRLVLSNGCFLGEPVALGPFPALQHLEVGVCDADGIAKLASISGCPQLTYLCVDGIADYFSLPALEPLQQLQVLVMPLLDFCTDEVAWALASCPRLRALQAYKLDLPLEWSGTAFQQLQRLRVEYITLPGPPPTELPTGAVGLLARLMPGLTSLRVDNGVLPVYDGSPNHSPHFLCGHTALRHLGLPSLQCLQPNINHGDYGQLLDAADLTAMCSLTSLTVEYKFMSSAPCPPAVLRAILQPRVWQHIQVLAVRHMRVPPLQEQVSTLLRAAPALRVLRFIECGASQLLDSVPHLHSLTALRTITLFDCGRPSLLAAGSPPPLLPGAPTPPFLQAFLYALSSPRHSSLACVRLELQLPTEADMQHPQAPHDPESRAQAAAALQCIRGHIEAAAQLLPGGQLPFAVHIEEMEAATAWLE